jgi:hypothetical protein
MQAGARSVSQPPAPKALLSLSLPAMARTLRLIRRDVHHDYSALSYESIRTIRGPAAKWIRSMKVSLLVRAWVFVMSANLNVYVSCLI